MLDHRINTLSNGLRVVTVEQPYLHSVTVCFLARCGSRHERDDHWGLSHLLEHMLFRGSRRFPETRDLARVFDRAGGALQASTWRDHTCFTSTLHPTQLPEVLVALGDMVSAPTFAGLNVERRIVEEELRSELDEDGEDNDLANISRGQVWQHHPMGRRITGSPDSLRRLNIIDLAGHHRALYSGRNAVLCIAGRVSAVDVERLVEEAFGQVPTGLGKPLEAPVVFNPGSQMYARQRPGSQVGLQLTFEALPDTHPQFLAQALLANILDDGMVSRLPHALCEKLGLVYELSSGLDCYADGGLYDIEMQLAPNHVVEAVDATLDVLQTLCAKGVTEQELDTVRRRHLHEMEFRVDSSEELAQQFGAACLFDRSQSLVSEGHKLLNISKASIDEMAKRLFCSGKIHVTLLGPLSRVGRVEVEKLVTQFARHRE